MAGLDLPGASFGPSMWWRQTDQEVTSVTIFDWPSWLKTVSQFDRKWQDCPHETNPGRVECRKAVTCFPA